MPARFLTGYHCAVRTRRSDLNEVGRVVILRLVRRPYGLHAIPAIIQTHASHVSRSQNRMRGWSHAHRAQNRRIACAAGATRPGRRIAESHARLEPREPSAWLAKERAIKLNDAG